MSQVRTIPHGDQSIVDALEDIQYNRHQLAKILGVSADSVSQGMTRGNMPDGFKLGVHGQWRWTKTTVRAYIERATSLASNTRITK